MGLRLRFALPLLISLGLILLALQFYWTPLQLKTQKDEFRRTNVSILGGAESALIRDLLARDIGSTFANLDLLQQRHQNTWVNLSYINDSGLQIYPLFEDPTTLFDSSGLIHVRYPLSISGTDLGALEVDVNWRGKRDEVLAGIAQIRNLIIGLIVVVIGITLASFQGAVLRPLRELSQATDNIAQRNFDVSLPKPPANEIGGLSRSFGLMLRELNFEKEVLDAHAIIYEADASGALMKVNDHLIEVSGFSREQLLGRDHLFLMDESPDGQDPAGITTAIRGGAVWSGELRNLTREGRPYWVSATIAPLLDENGQVERYLSIQTDITAQKNEERARFEAETRAATDVLTGLYNRRRLDQELEKAVERRNRYELDFSIMLLDMDHFKSVNDTYGHLVGDDVLIALADLLRQEARKVDTLGRWGGEEFLIICPGVDVDGARTLAERIRSAVETHRFETVGLKTISVGVVSCTRDETITGLLARADAALYEAKESGRNRVIAR